MEFFLHWAYIGLTAVLAGLLLKELFTEDRWKLQLAIVVVLIPLVLRVLHIK